MISPIDNLIHMLFKWGMGILSNIILGSNTQSMKFEILYGNYKRLNR
jgi:hypothetical protein